MWSESLTCEGQPVIIIEINVNNSPRVANTFNIYTGKRAHGTTDNLSPQACHSSLNGGWYGNTH